MAYNADSGRCPEVEYVNLFLEGRANQNLQIDIRAHAARCPNCEWLVIGLEDEALSASSMRPRFPVVAHKSARQMVVVFSIVVMAAFAAWYLF